MSAEEKLISKEMRSNYIVCSLLFPLAKFRTNHDNFRDKRLHLPWPPWAMPHVCLSHAMSMHATQMILPKVNRMYLASLVSYRYL
jgi:hypothetical protein